MLRFAVVRLAKCDRSFICASSLLRRTLAHRHTSTTTANAANNIGRRIFGLTLAGGVLASATIGYAYADTSTKSKHTHYHAANTSNEVPASVPYLLIGAGTASYYAAMTIRARDPDAKVLIIGDEDEIPYSRTQLSKELWWYGDDHVSENLQYIGFRRRKKDVFYEVDGFYVKPQDLKQFKNGCITLIKNRKVLHIDTAEKLAVLDTGEAIKFDKCLIATGSRPRKIAALDSSELKGRVHTLRTTKDFRAIDSAARTSKTIAIVGGGYLGSELAYSLLGYFKGLNIVEIFEEDDVLQHVLPSQLCADASKQMFKQGVRVMNRSSITNAVTQPNGQVCLTVKRKDDSREDVVVDHIIVAAGVQPNVEVAIASELGIDKNNGGILTDELMRAAPDIYTAGDVSSFNDLKLGHRRLEHSEHAEISGRVAGENMTAGKRTYPRQASWKVFISPESKFTAVGKVDSSMETVVVSAQKSDPDVDEKLRAIAFYTERSKIAGLVLYNLPEENVLIARKVIENQTDAAAVPDIARLFRLYADATNVEDMKGDNVKADDEKADTKKMDTDESITT